MRKLGLLVIILSVGLTGKAQFKIGVSGFPQISATSSIVPFKKEVVNNHNLPTFTGGAGLVFTYDSYVKPFGAQLGIAYSSQNQTYLYNYEIGGNHYKHRGKLRFDYVQFSLLARKTARVSRYVKSVFFIGPQFSYLLKYAGGAVVYQPNTYFDLPPTTTNIYYKKYSIDAVVGYGLDYAIHKNFDVFANLRLGWGLNNIANQGVTYNGVKVFDGGGVHQITYALQVGGCYVFHRKDHLLLPGNTYRYRPYKKKKIVGRKK
ncbi:MAG TPA: outer membrane beta-barrel protein [Cytophagaceae bacterium]|jgi:hypothetical protein|nr:outer membrane beta-barrel protein [Cytophagaceae bacterium]